MPLAGPTCLGRWTVCEKEPCLRVLPTKCDLGLEQVTRKTAYGWIPEELVQ